MYRKITSHHHSNVLKMFDHKAYMKKWNVENREKKRLWKQEHKVPKGERKPVIQGMPRLRKGTGNELWKVLTMADIEWFKNKTQ